MGVHIRFPISRGVALTPGAKIREVAGKAPATVAGMIAVVKGNPWTRESRGQTIRFLPRTRNPVRVGPTPNVELMPPEPRPAKSIASSPRFARSVPWPTLPPNNSNPTNSSIFSVHLRRGSLLIEPAPAAHSPDPLAALMRRHSRTPPNSVTALSKSHKYHHLNRLPSIWLCSSPAVLQAHAP